MQKEVEEVTGWLYMCEYADSCSKGCSDEPPVYTFREYLEHGRQGTYCQAIKPRAMGEAPTDILCKWLRRRGFEHSANILKLRSANEKA